VKALGYVHVSTAEQKRKDGALEAQRRAIRTACEERGWELLRIKEDTGFGGKINGHLQTTLDALDAKQADQGAAGRGADAPRHSR